MGKPAERQGRKALKSKVQTMTVRLQNNTDYLQPNFFVRTQLSLRGGRLFYINY